MRTCTASSRSGIPTCTCMPQAIISRLTCWCICSISRRAEVEGGDVRGTVPVLRAPQERELALMNRIRQALENETPVRAMGLTPEEELTLSGFNLISAKPMLIVLNIAEEDAPRTEEIEAEGRGTFEGRNTAVIALCARFC